MKRYITMAEVIVQARWVADNYAERSSRVWGVPRGGIPCAMLVATIARCQLAASADDATLVIDDIWDSGATERQHNGNYTFVALFDKRKAGWKDQWLVMPWEVDPLHDTSGQDIITRLLQFIGEDPKREGLIETPRRVIQAWGEWSSGYHADPMEVMKTFQSDSDEMVIVHKIPVISKCEHHLADIIGHAHVGYIPDGKIIGLSKIPRLVNIFARRLQVQERLTGEIADALVKGIAPKGVGVIVRAEHGCISTRGVRVHGSTTTTSAMRGVFMDATARAEFIILCANAEK